MTEVDESSDTDDLEAYINELPSNPTELTDSQLRTIEALLLSDDNYKIYITSKYLRNVSQSDVEPLKPILSAVIKSFMKTDVMASGPIFEILNTYDLDDVVSHNPVTVYREQLMNEQKEDIERLKAARALGEYSLIDSDAVQRAVPDLIDTMESSEGYPTATNIWAARSLGTIAGAVDDKTVQDQIVERFLQILRSEDNIPDKTAIAGLKYLAPLEPESVEPAIDILLQIAETPVDGYGGKQRWNAVDTLGDLGEAAPEILLPELDRLVELFDAEPRLLRKSTAEALGQIAEAHDEHMPTITDALVSAANDDDAAVRKAAIEALKPFPDKRDEAASVAIPKFIDDLDKTELNEIDTSDAAYAFGDLAEDYPESIREAIPILSRALCGDPEIVGSNVRSGVVGALGELGAHQPEDIRPMVDSDVADDDFAAKETPLLDATDDETDFVRKEAVQALCQLAKEDQDVIPLIKPKLRDKLDDKNSVERQVIEGIGLIGSEHSQDIQDLLPAVVQRLGHRSPTVRASAAEALGNIVASDPLIVEKIKQPLVETLDDHEPEVRANACWALAETGATDAGYNIEPLLSDPESAVRDAAEEALDTLDYTPSTAKSEREENNQSRSREFQESHTTDGSTDSENSTTSIGQTDQSTTDSTDSGARESESSTKEVRIATADETQPVPDLKTPYEAFDVDHRIGRGGSAEVYKATIQRDGKQYTVALKEPIIDGTISSKTIEEFNSEAEVWEKLSDRDHIVGVVDWGSQPMPWMAVEYMNAGTLDEYIDRLTIRQSLVVADQLASAIRHDRTGVVHLDLKPSNILFTESEDGSLVTKVADWGLARFLSEQGGSVDGLSTHYAAPEQFDPEGYGELDSRTDIYQLGVILYEMLTGSPPFTGSDARVLKATLYDDPDPPSEVVDIPSALDDLVLTALSKNQSDRYATVERFQASIREHL